MSGSPQDSDSPPPDDVDRIERVLGWRPTAFRPATAERGPSATAAHWIVADRGEPAAGRRSAFVKIGATGLTPDWLRTEYRNYRSLRGWFLPEVLGFDDDGDRPVLALEDLSAAAWPPPWTDERVAAVLDALAAIRGTPPPDHLIPHEGDGGVDWQVVAADPEPFLALGICTSAWLDAALPAHMAAAASAPLAGETLVHLDIRSDNLCFRHGRAIVIDWNHAVVANSDLDVAFWLPSLHAEGGPPPDTLLSDAPGLAAWVTGYFCARAGKAPIVDAPHVRPLQIQQSRTALPWAARALGLPPP
jgi:hypothetical protein